ncbi:hypothetical protein WR164_08410 [Philodulcilactobacillus myokoensis]|uniref:DegV family protein n=1 Tax=Philodulcilactobacillus myokoensis TaxID=2929573 RepID=A0A9W6B0U2_9LACO|nr:DegV family protein [Philodulcilactobacillus myokoensis]GLB46862.1 hypothetical protein WR164_08410 [Philodulcilactobacillus myokoensis]
MKIAVVTDSTAYLSHKERDAYNIKVISIPLVINGKTYHEGVDISTDDFYDQLKQADQLPTTSQPPMGEVIKVYRKLAKEGYDAVISIHLASTISGFLDQLKSVAKSIKDIKVIPYDSKITVKLMGYLAMAAGKMAQENLSVDEIIHELNRLRSTINEVFIVDDLKNLVKGGRLSNASALIGSLLRIKPLLTFDNHTDKIVAFDKVRSRKRALKRCEELFKQSVQKVDYPVKAIIINGNDPKGGDVWAKNIQQIYPNMTVEQSYFGPVIGTHLGAKALAIGWMKDFDKEFDQQ